MVFEEQVAYYLDKYLGKFVRGLSKEALKISVWQGNVELTNMQLKPEALNALKLPVKVKAGFLGSVKLKVPWSRLGQEPVVVLLDRIFLLAEPATSVEGQDGDAVQEAKMTRVTEAERKLVEAKGEEAMKEDVNNSSWLGSLISTIIGNLKLSISNIHIRYEDTESHPGHAFSGGLTLEKLAAVTVDENGKETFVTGGSLDRIQKAAELQRLAVYFDPDTEPWTSPRKWEDLSPTEWAEIFVPGIKSDTAETDGKAAASGAGKLHSYVLKPIGGNARYFKLASKDQRTPEKPAQKATVLLKDVTVGVSEDQYRDVLKVVENFSTFNKRLQYAHYRPSVPITEDRRGWWQYAVKAVTEEWKRASGHVSWKRVLTLSVVRKKYLSLYISALQSASPDQISITNNKEIRDMDRELDTDVIIQWRLMAHTYVDENRAKDQKRRQQQNRGWWPFGWGGSGNEEQESKFSEEDLEKLNEIIGYRSGEQSNVLPGEDPPNMLHTLLEVHMQHNATKLVAHDGEELLDVSSDDLHVVLHMYPKTIKFDLKLDSYKVGCPEGLLAESASIKEAVTATFTYLPLDIENGGTKDSGQKLDWSFAAKASPLYVTVLMPSINKVTKFFQSSKAVSRSVALDTATALQSTLDEVTKNAQQQINNALKDRPRFSIDLDLAAPKITIPTDFRPDGVHECNLLVDLGYFSLQTELEDDGTLSSEEQELYMRFKMRLTDVSAILADGEHDWKNQDEIYANLKERKENARREKYLPLLEKCGMLLAVQQICVPHPLYPSTRVALKLPSLGFHISPSRYHRLMQIMKVFQSDSKDDEVVRPWEPSDFEGKISVLAWKGVGHREAVWQQRYAVLTGPFIYILENPSAQSYKYCSSIIGKQVTIVPPGSMGDIPYVLAVCDAGQFNNKVAESVSALILRFDDESIMNGWHSRLMGAIYRMSAPAAVASLMSSRNEGDQENAMVATSQANEKSNVSEQESIFVVGELDELKIIISNGQQGNNEPTAILLEPESPLLEFRAIGTKVEFVQRKFDMSVGLVLQVLEIEDKFYGHISPSCKYLARSNIESSKSSSAPRIQKRPSLDGGPSQRKPLLHPSQGRRSLNRGKRVSKERRLSATERDRFFDATEELEAEGPTARLKRNSNSGLEFFDAEELGAEDPPTFKRTDGLLPVVSGAGKEQHKTRDEVLRDFVKVQAIVSSQESPNYSNIDKQVTVTLATLSFFSNRRTLLALMDLVSAITAEVVPKDDDDPAPASTESDAVVSTINPKAIGDNEDVDESQAGLNRNESVVRGLLGKGKSRLIFLVTMKMDRAQIVLNTEDGAQLSVLSIADLRTEVKVFPSSFGIKATLGNLQVSDGSLDDNHPYHYLCNMRDPEGESFIQLEFLSFNKEDDDYEGFEYSIMGKLSEVRIVYLNRFIQEIVGYLMGLVPQSSDYVVKLKDKVTDVDTYISQSEIEGQPAMKLGLSLNKPVIIMPRATSSDDFLELDILHINLYNTFQWLGGDEKELGAVRLETTTLELEDLHLVVGLGGKTGEGIIQEARGLALTLRRPIRDLWHQLPVAEASIKIDELRAALSDQEYQLITECATSNINETPNLLPPVVEVAPENDGSENGKAVETVVQESGTPENDSAEAEDSGGSTREAWTTVKVGVDIEKVELGLYSGGSRQSPLASIQVAGVWASYKSNTIQESNVQATLKKFSVRDDREGTQAEMRYMIGNADDNESSAAGKMVEGFEEEDGGDQADKDKAMAKSAPCDRPGCTSAMTMLVMDAKLSPNLQMVSLRIQRPRLLVALDFLLAVAEFFVPSMHAMRSDGKGDENPLEIQNAIMLTEKVYVQSAKEVILSPKRPLVADVEGLTTYTYDGRGGSIRLLDREQADLRDFSQEVVILIGDGKKLIFKDVVIQNGDYLDSCISLGTNSSYSASEHDGVFLEGQPEHRVDVDRQKGQEQNDQNELARSDKGGEDKPAVELIFDLQAVSPELTFYDSLAKAAESVLLPERILRARLNIFSRFILKGEDMELNAQVNGMVVEAGSGVQVVEPVDMIVKYTSFAGSQKVVVASSEIHANFSFSTIQLILRLQTDVMSFLRITSEQTTVECSQFDKVWANDDESEGANCITFWRPRAPPGFAILGDCMTPRDELPSKGVIAVNMSLARVKRPVEMVRLWSSDQVRPPSVEGTSDEDDDSNNLCSVWLPVPPPGYVALGCVANPGKRPPPLNTSFCVLAPLVALCGMKDCINITSQIRNEEGESEEWSFWRVDNSTGSFFMGAAVNPPYNYRPYELRQVIAHYESFPVQETKPNHASNQDSTQDGSSVHDSSSSTRERILPTLSLPSGRIYENVARFTLVWWDKGSGSSRGVSIWRPVVPSECVILGDVAIEGYEPPSSGVVMHDLEETGLLIKPTSFKKMDQLPRKRGLEGVSFYLPVAPSGYVSLGCVAGVGSSPGAEDLVRCIRSDLVIGSNFTTSSLWKTSETKYKKQELSIWPVENEASTFIVGRGFKHPPRRLALGLADLKKPDAPDNLSVDAKFDQISATVCDDFGGLMAPLLDVSVSDIFLNVRGRTEALSCSLKFSASATTFNGKYSAWEPLIEPLEGHVRYEFTSYPSEEARPTESKLRLTASSALNVNVSTANVNMLLEAYASWNRFNQMEESSNKSFSIDSRGRTNSKSAISAKTAKTLSCMNHNELGEELFLRIVEHNQPKVLSLASGGTVAVKLPSAQIFQDPKSKATRRKRRHQIVAIRIGDAEIPREGGIGGREYMLAIRIVPRSQTADQQQLQYQSARTRCVAPDDGPPSKTVKVHWDEVFIFEIEPQEGNVAEVVVTDLSKGTPLGYMSMELQEDDTNSTKLRPGKTFGSRLPFDSLALEWSSLYPVQGAENTEGDSGAPCGQVSFGKHFFSPVGNPTKELELDATGHEFGTFQVGPARKGPWASVGLNYALGPAPFIVNDDLIASEFYVDEGVKHLVLRSLVGVQNGTDIDVEVSLCMRALLEKSLGEEFGANEYIGENVEEECFENERYQPVIGWGSKWPGYLLPTDPAHYSARDFTKPSVQFPEVKLPLGWEWSSDWHVDKVPGGDQDGWGYGFDFRSLDWPPHSAGRATSFVRRRRWIRTRKSVAEGGPRVMLGVLQPAGKLSLPIASLRESSVNYFLQIRPKVDHGPSYEWSQVTSNKGYRDRVKPQGIKEISVRALVETEELLSCSIASTSSSVQAKDVWFFLESSCTVIGKDEDLDPIKEWKLVITSSMMLRNHLPVPCEYSVSEKTSGKRLIVRDRGVLNPGDAAAIFHADVRKAIYLTWLPKGGWNPQKECVLISHPHRQPADRIAYSNTRTSRPLEVMIDHDDDEKGVAAKVLKFYVPCWLDSSKCPPLRYRIMEILQRDESKIASRTDSRTTKVPFEGVIVGNVAEELNFEERNGYPIMLSDVDFKTMGLSVAITTEGPIQFGPLSPLQPLNDPDGSLELRGLAEEGSCFRFLVSTESTPFDFAKSKVIRIRPYVLFTNRLGESLYLKQPESEEFSTLLRSNWRVSFPSAAIDDQDRLQVRLDGHEWSRPFSIESEASLTIALRKKDQGRTFIRVSIRSYEEGSRFSIVFRLGSTHGPYRMENRTADYIVKFRQLGLEDSSWEQLKPHSTLNFTWEDPRGERLLELLPANAESSSIIRYDIDKVGDHPDLVQDVGQTVSIRVVEILDIKTIRIYNRLVDAEEEEEEIEAAAAPNAVDSSQRDERLEVPAATQMEIVISIGIFGLSVINQHPREILYLSLDNVNMTYQMGFGDRISRFKLRIGYLQLDNQLPLSWMPVLLAPEGRLESEFLLKFSLVMYDAKAADMEVYPYIGFQVENTFRINVHEPIIWAIVDMYNNIHLDRLSDDSNVVQVDPEVKIDLIDLSEVRLKLTLETASAARPRGMLGVWSPLVTTLGNTTKMPIHLGSVVRQSRYVRKSMLSTAIVNRIRRDLIHQPLQLLSGVDVLGMTSSTLGTLSQGAAQLSRDGTYLRLRSSKDRSRNISGVGEGLLQGTEALARGFGYGLSGVVTKPVSNAKRAGFTGFFKGVGKAALGVVMLPVSGILDFVSLTVNGVGVTCTSCFEIFDRDSRYQRRRLPRALRGGSVLYTFDFHDAAGLAILQLAQSGSFISLKGVFSEPAEFAMSDTYEAHFELPKSRILMLTNKRILMLGRPKSHFQNPDKTFTDPTSVLWKVSWKNLLAVERIDHDPSIVLHLRSSTKTFARRIRCQNEDPEDLHSQRRGVFTVVNRLWKEYGPDKKSLLLEKRKRNLSARLRPRLRSKTPSSPRDKDNQERRLKFANSNSGNAHPVGRFAKDVVAFEQIWSSEREATGSCCGGNVSGELCTIWRAITPEGYVSVGDIARIGLDSPPVAITYRNDTGVFALPQSYDLVWRNWQDAFTTPISIWKPVPPEGYVAVGCVAMASYMEPDPDAVWCVREDFTDVTSLEAKEVWHAPNGAPWRCLIYPVVSDSLSFMAIRDSKRISNEVYHKVKAPDVE